MIDTDLITELEGVCRITPGISLLNSQTTEALLERIAAKFSVDRSRLWWWEGVQPTRVVECSSVGELADLERLMPQSAELTLVVTDDESPPWVAVLGTWRALSQMLRETRHFEFFVVNDRLDWIVFSTHDGKLIAAGDLTVSG